MDIKIANAESLTLRDLRIINKLVKQQSECKNCNGNRLNCQKAIVQHRDNGDIYFDFQDCAKATEYKLNSNKREILKSANIPNIFSNSSAAMFQDFVKSRKFNNANMILDAAEEAILDNRSIFLFGETGAGKTYLSSVIAIERAKLNKYSSFYNVPDVLEALREFNVSKVRYSDELNREERMHKLYSCPCLILDDLGAEKPSDWTSEVLFKIINRRYNDGSQVIVSSNFDIGELNEYLNSVNGKRIARRLRDMCRIVEMS